MHCLSSPLFEQSGGDEFQFVTRLVKKENMRPAVFYFRLQVYELLYGLGSTDIATDFSRERKKKILDSSIPVAGGRWRADNACELSGDLIRITT
jgi:hypothetical protein